MMQCCLFSSAPEPSPSALVELVLRMLGERKHPLIAYLPAGNLQRHFVREVKGFFRGIAEVSAIKPEIHPIKRVLSILDHADLLLIPGGNTYLMAQRLHKIGLVGELRQRIVDGLPLVTLSAGTVLCGQDILTTNDINCCGCTQFEGLQLFPFNFNVHYPSSPIEAQQERDERLEEYQFFHDTPILALEDGACVQAGEHGLQTSAGVWEFKHGLKVKRAEAEWQPLQLA
jgi:peptidase E